MNELTQLEMIVKSLYLTLIGLKIILELIAFTLFYQWQRVVNSRFHRGMLLFLVLLIISSLAQTFIQSTLSVEISHAYIAFQVLETCGWGIFVYTLIKEE